MKLTTQDREDALKRCEAVLKMPAQVHPLPAPPERRTHITTPRLSGSNIDSSPQRAHKTVSNSSTTTMPCPHVPHGSPGTAVPPV